MYPRAEALRSANRELAGLKPSASTGPKRYVDSGTGLEIFPKGAARRNETKCSVVGYSGDGRWCYRPAVERRGFGSPLGSLRAAEGGKSSVDANSDTHAAGNDFGLTPIH